MDLVGLVVPHLPAVSSPNVEGWRQASELGLALLLSALIGFERELRQKSAGLRTHTLVGVGAALFMLISKYGFNDVLEPGRVILDPSRVAAQIVTGVGFLGAGLIFVRRDSVRGLTTAAAIWVTAAVGAASGAGLPVLAAMTTGIYFVVALIFPAVTRRLPQSSTAISEILRQLLQLATDRGFVIDEVSTETLDHSRARSGEPVKEESRAVAEVTLHVHGKSSINQLAAVFSELDEVEAVLADDINAVQE
jgi:putative Mg2+ transporter-C (MgtC) family protein